MTYEYICQNCSHNWEQEQKITENAIKECPNCNKQTAKRLISKNSSFILLGSGWASEGYKS